MVPAGAGEETEDSFQIHHFRAVQKVSDSAFMLIHKSDDTRNVQVGFETGANGSVTWTGIPRKYLTVL